MNYYYDLFLNFQERYYMFYEWDQEDVLEFIKKIPLFHVNEETYNDFLKNKIIICSDILKKIENKTKLKQNKYLKYTAIFSDGKNSLAIEFNDEGLSINKSSLLLEDEINIHEFMYSIEKTFIDYKNVFKEKIFKETRQELRIKRILNIEIDSMYHNNEISKLKYTYLEWFNELEDDTRKMYLNMKKKLNQKLTKREYHIYDLIKITYNV